MGIRKEKRREFIAEVMRQLEAKKLSVLREAWQQRPCTAVRVLYQPDVNAPSLVGIGFAKVSWPDKWNAEEGLRIATEKAVARIWRQVFKP